MNKLRKCLALGFIVGSTAGCGPVPVENTADDIASAGHAPSATALATPVHVRVAAVQVADIQHQATTVGLVEAFRTAAVAAETNGRVTHRAVEPGDLVVDGQVLVTLDKERALIALDQASAIVRAREVDLEQASSELRRGQDLRARNFISEDNLERLTFGEARARSAVVAARAELAAAERGLSDTDIRAPFPGIVEKVHVHEGDYLNPGAAVAMLADFSKVRVKAGVTAREATLLRGVDQAEVTLDVLGPDPLQGDINSIARVADRATGAYVLELWLEDLAKELRNRLREGMVATIHLPPTESTARLVVPSTTVFRRDGTMHVFLVEKHRALLRPVRTGQTNGPVVEVLEGLAEGELVVTDGQFALRDGAPVTIAD